MKKRVRAALHPIPAREANNPRYQASVRLPFLPVRPGLLPARVGDAVHGARLGSGDAVHGAWLGSGGDGAPSLLVDRFAKVGVGVGLVVVNDTPRARTCRWSCFHHTLVIVRWPSNSEIAEGVAEVVFIIVGLVIGVSEGQLLAVAVIVVVIRGG